MSEPTRIVPTAGKMLDLLKRSVVIAASIIVAVEIVDRMLPRQPQEVILRLADRKPFSDRLPEATTVVTKVRENCTPAPGNTLGCRGIEPEEVPAKQNR